MEIKGAELVLAERLRQKTEEGYDSRHDCCHDTGDLAINAARLAVAHTDATISDPHTDDQDPWGLIVKHKHDEVRSLVIAGALICAEIDRVIARDGAPDLIAKAFPGMAEAKGILDGMKVRKEVETTINEDDMKHETLVYQSKDSIDPEIEAPPGPGPGTGTGGIGGGHMLCSRCAWSCCGVRCRGTVERRLQVCRRPPRPGISL